MDTVNTVLPTIPDTITQITEQLFKHNIQGMLNDTISVIERTQSISKDLDNEEQSFINEIIQYIYIAVENKDYLLVTDLLTYEMLPFVNKLNERSGLYDHL